MAFTSALNEDIGFSDPDVNGVVQFRSPAGELDLHFSWETLQKLQTQWGEDFLTKAAAGMDDLNIEDFAVIVAAASGESERKVRKAGYPLLPLSNACKLAWSHAWNGGEPIEPKDEDAAPEKTQARLSLFGWRLRAPFVRA